MYFGSELSDNASKMLPPASTFLAILSLLMVSVHGGDDVIELGDSDFLSTMAGFDTTLVKFYAPWCGHCKRLAPAFAEAATVLSRNDPPVTLVKVDCTEAGKDTCGNYGVSGYPTLKIFKKDVLSADYEGPRDKDGIVSYMRKKAGPASKELTSMAAANKLLDSAEITVVGFFDEKDSDLDKKFQKLAEKKSDDFRFAHTYSEEVAEGLKHKDAIVIYRPRKMATKLEEGEVVYTSGDLESFVTSNAFGLCGRRTNSNRAYFTKKPLFTAVYNVDYELNPKGSNYVRNRVMKVGKKFAGRAYFSIAAKSELSHEIDEHGVSSSEDVIILAQGSQGEKFSMEGKFSMDTFEAFVNDVLDGKIQPYIKSEPAPTSNDGPVKVVVGSTFDEIVNDDNKDVLIEFYAPWCGHCKQLEPKYTELGEKLQHNTNLVIAKMDATANDVPPPYKVSGFPTIYFAPKGSKSDPKRYEGGREVTDFIAYLKREATDPVTDSKTEL